MTEKQKLEGNKVVTIQTFEDRREYSIEEINTQLAYWQKLKDLFRT